MNERIKELADKAELTIRTGRGNTYMSHPEFNKKFAELIVRECAKVVFEKTGPKSALNVLEHFGVEE